MTKYKEMEYHTDRTIKILCEDNYKGYNYFIISYGTHPCAYVEIPKNHPYYGVYYMDIEDIDVHGGLTYSSSGLLLRDNTWIIGWDYAHYGDYMGYNSIFNDETSKRWTTKEIISECKYVINQIIRINDDNE